MLDCKEMGNRGYRVIAWRRTRDRLELDLLRRSSHPDARGRMELRPLAAGIIRVRLSERDLVERESETVVLKPEPVDWAFHEEAGRIVLTTDSLRVEVMKDSGAIRWLDANGNLLVGEPADGGKFLEETAVMRTEWEAGTRIVEEITVDGVKQRISGKSRQVADRKAYSTLLCLQLHPDEIIHGLGQHEDGIFDYRRAQQFLYQGNMKVSIPTIVSSRGYAIHFDQHCFAWYEGDEEGCRFWSECVPQMEFYFIRGESLDAVVKRLRLLTGNPPMLPRWAYGFIQSKERYETRQELIDVVKRHREEGVPLDCIVLDWSSWEEGLWGQKSLDPERFPDPKGMMDSLHGMDARLMISIWPNMRGNGINQREMREWEYLLPNDSTYDSLNPGARQLYWAQARSGLFDHGIDAWWCDCTEPFEGDWKGTLRRPPWERARICTDEFRKFMDPEWMNAYSVFHSMGIYEGQRSSNSSKRVVNLTRSSGPSQQRFGTITWSGDIEARWSRLRRQLADGLNFVVTGNPRWTFDIGAFFVKPGVPWFWDGQYPEGNRDLGYRELYTRWYQAGAFLPMFRSHGTDTAREIWNFGEPGTPFYDTIKSFTELRYRLIHYIYSLAAREVFHGYTMFRSLAFDFAGDPECLRISDQFMLGPALMACPVLEPMYYEAHSRKLEDVPRVREAYLPAGSDWFDFWTGRRHGGGQRVELDAPIERMPLLVRAGSIIPFGPVIRHTGEARAGDVEFHVWPGRDGRFDFYEDAGDGYAYEQGEYCWTPVHWNDSARELRFGESEGRFNSGLNPDNPRLKVH